MPEKTWGQNGAVCTPRGIGGEASGETMENRTMQGRRPVWRNPMGDGGNANASEKAAGIVGGRERHPIWREPARESTLPPSSITYPIRDDRDTCTEQELWEMLRKRYPKILAFDYSDGCEILVIKPQDIGLLPREVWVYGNNSFLLHGYYNYRYLILARLNNPSGSDRYLLGVPGHYLNNEKYMASMFGFSDFVLSKKQPPKDGRFGYWYTDIRIGD